MFTLATVIATRLLHYFSAMSSIVLLLGCLSVVVSGSTPHYTNTWAVEVEDGKEKADAVAEKYNFVNKGQVR